jgi:GR25 family glycosyltransferase involved in LPS biosynthesis
MNNVKVYYICENETEFKWAKSQCQDIQKKTLEREGGSLNVKYIFKSHDEGFKCALNMIRDNELYEFGVILFGNEHLHRRFWTALDKISKKFAGSSLHLFIGKGILLNDNHNNTSIKKMELILEETVPKGLSIFYTELEHNKMDILKITHSCFISKCLLIKQEQIIDGIVQPALSLPEDVYKHSSIVHYCPTEKQYIPSLSMIHYCSPLKESLFNSLFDGVYCINLSSRPDRLINFTNKMRLHGIRFERFNAVSKTFLNPFSQLVMPDDPLLVGSANKSGLLGCLLSHMGVMNLALSRGQKQVLIFEDDVSIHKDADLLLKSFMKSLEDNNVLFKDIDIVHFGYLPVIEKGDQKRHDVYSYRFLSHYKNIGTLLKSKHFIGCHAYAVSEKFMKAYISYYKNLKVVEGVVEGETEMKGWPTNDWAIRDSFLEDKNFSCFAPCPQIFSVSSSFSDNSCLSDDDDVEKRLTNSNFTYFDDYQ